MKHPWSLYLLVVVLIGCTPAGAQGVDATPTLAPALIPPAATATAVPTLSPTAIPVANTEPSEISATPVESREWQRYANDDYGFAFRYPATWTLAKDPIELGMPGGRAPHAIVLRRDPFRLLIQYKGANEDAVVGPGGHGAGDIVDWNAVTFFGQGIVKKALVFEGRVKSVFFGGPVQDLFFWVQLDHTGMGVDYSSIDLDEAVQAEFNQIVISFVRTQAAPSWQVAGWLGYVTGSSAGAQFDDALVLMPEGAGRVGIAGSTPELEAEIVALRDKPAPGNQAHFWGTLTCGVPDAGGCQLVVTRLRYGATDTEPEPVDGWEGTLVSLKAAGSNPPGAQFDDYFVLRGRFGAAYGLHSLDTNLQAQIEALRDTGAPFRVWGVLRCGIPDAFGSQIEVTRID